jgi:DNA polymerase
VDIDKKKADEIKTGWRLGNSDIVQFWRDIEEGAKEAILNKQDKPVEVGKIKFKSVNNFLWCALPSGRNIAYFQPCVGYKTVTCFTHKVADETTGAIRENTVVYDVKDHGSLQAFQKTAKSLQSDTFDFQGSTIKFSGSDSKTRRWCPQTTYGGKLVENITQAVARDVMAESMLLLEEEGYEIVLTVHDEIISEVEHGTVERFKEVMEKPPTWGQDIPIQVEAYEATRYRK